MRDHLSNALHGMLVRKMSSPVAQMEYKAFHDLQDCKEIRDMLPEVARWVAEGHHLMTLWA